MKKIVFIFLFFCSFIHEANADTLPVPIYNGVPCQTNNSVCSIDENSIHRKGTIVSALVSWNINEPGVLYDITTIKNKVVANCKETSLTSIYSISYNGNNEIVTQTEEEVLLVEHANSNSLIAGDVIIGYLCTYQVEIDYEELVENNLIKELTFNN